MNPQSPSSARGTAAAAFAFFTWGILPLFWKQFHWLAADVVVALRAVMCVPVVVVLLAARGQGRSWLKAAARPRALALHAITALLLGVNWLLFVWATQHGQILESSLGYFLTPLMNVALGALVLRERPTRGQAVALLIAAVGVAIQVFGLGRLPWIALALSTSFATYGLLRKMAHMEALKGLALESLISLPFALAWLHHLHGGFPAHGARQLTLVLTMGLVTVLPLWAFAFGARTMSMTSLGMFQFLTPILHFLCGWAVYGEPMQPARLLSFVLIWCALGVFLWDLFHANRRRARAGAPSPA